MNSSYWFLKQTPLQLPGPCARQPSLLAKLIAALSQLGVLRQWNLHQPSSPCTRAARSTRLLSAAWISPSLITRRNRWYSWLTRLTFIECGDGKKALMSSASASPFRRQIYLGISFRELGLAGNKREMKCHKSGRPGRRWKAILDFYAAPLACTPTYAAFYDRGRKRCHTLITLRMMIRYWQQLLVVSAAGCCRRAAMLVCSGAETPVAVCMCARSSLGPNLFYIRGMRSTNLINDHRSAATYFVSFDRAANWTNERPLSTKVTWLRSAFTTKPGTTFSIYF